MAVQSCWKTDLGYDVYGQPSNIWWSVYEKKISAFILQMSQTVSFPCLSELAIFLFTSFIDSTLLLLSKISV